MWMNKGVELLNQYAIGALPFAIICRNKGTTKLKRVFMGKILEAEYYLIVSMSSQMGEDCWLLTGDAESALIRH